jgi:HicB-like protein involved in pilus formation
MSTLSVRLPNSLHRQLRDVAVREGVSMNQLISSAIGEKLAALLTEEYLARAVRGSRKPYEDVLRKVRDVAPEGKDKLKRMQLTKPAPRQARRRRLRS